MEFAASAEGQRLPRWQIDVLSRVEWPADMSPTAETYRGLQRALDLTVDEQLADRLSI